jgi:hypothetical protein
LMFYEVNILNKVSEYFAPRKRLISILNFLNDWLHAVQFKPNTSTKCLTLVDEQKNACHKRFGQLCSIMLLIGCAKRLDCSTQMFETLR